MSKSIRSKRSKNLLEGLGVLIGLIITIFLILAIMLS
jgi:hypothetical protein